MLDLAEIVGIYDDYEDNQRIKLELRVLWDSDSDSIIRYEKNLKSVYKSVFTTQELDYLYRMRNRQTLSSDIVFMHLYSNRLYVLKSFS